MYVLVDPSIMVLVLVLVLVLASSPPDHPSKSILGNLQKNTRYPPSKALQIHFSNPGWRIPFLDCTGTATCTNTGTGTGTGTCTYVLVDPSMSVCVGLYEHVITLNRKLINKCIDVYICLLTTRQMQHTWWMAKGPPPKNENRM